ncbi:MAG TPA: helix-turn-helix domain-containing protein [Deinococcales bacterium]|nr:helix-turn-helix domain-containing protein [Deinococcales bacterium]
MHALRKERGVPLRVVVETAGITTAYLSKLERGEANPTLDVLRGLAKAYSMTLDELTAGTDGAAAEPGLPPSLAAFIAKYKDDFVELDDPDWHRTLANVRFRGRYPEDAADWMHVFTGLRAALSRSKK